MSASYWRALTKRYKAGYPFYIWGYVAVTPSVYWQDLSDSCHRHGTRKTRIFARFGGAGDPQGGLLRVRV
ncbi:hypothetical protein GBS0709_29820 [Edwardsiella tarda]|nr:hypothetical protein GBS0709_29820 [Edwardsiella tarda]